MPRSRIGPVATVRRPVVVTVAVAAVSLVAAAVSPVTPAVAAPAWHPPQPQHQQPVPGHTAAAVPAPASRVGARAWKAAPAVAWPAAGSAEVDLASAASLVRAGSLPVRVGRASGKGTAPGRVRVQVLDRAAAERAHVTGVALTVSAVDAGSAGAAVQAGRVSVRVDYSGFRYAYGGDWAARLRLVRLPSCAMSTPDVSACQHATPLVTRNDVAAGSLSAEVDLAGAGPTLLAATAAPAGSTGDYKATKLSPSSTWDVSEQTGDFTWSYPVDTPDSPGGLDPDLSLSYSSQSVDGRTVSTNNQTSWVGEGFDLWPGFVERGYDSCVDDGVSSKPGDLCWAYDNATLSLNGHATELVRDDASGVWRPRDDDGSRVQKVTGASNGDDDGEYWKVTTVDGTQYYFGLNRLPGWVSGKPETRSAWTVPVFGDDAGEPCHDSTFDGSWCRQAWRWNLDYVVDPHGNAMSLWYAPETNYYNRDLSTAKVTSYTRGGYLTEVDYGQRSDSVFSAQAPARVVFSVAERCLPDATFDCAEDKFTKTNASHWPDVPFDQYCGGSSCTNYSPTFWTRKMLSSVTTQVLSGTSYRDVDSWSLTHQFPASGDGTAPGLWLAGISRTGKVGGTASIPDVAFDGIQLDNRVDATEGLPPLYKWRVSSISNETGGQVSVSYTPHDCAAGATPAPDANTTRCFPQYWVPDGAINPQLDWFHKYAVAQVVEVDRTGGSAGEVTSYDYADPAWHYDDDSGLTKDKYKTWSQFRGFAHVTVTHGDASGPRSQTGYLFLQGMDGDRLADGSTRHVTVTDAQGGTITDQDPLQGFQREEIVYDGVGGPVVTDEVDDPFLHGPTATRVQSWGTVRAYVGEVAAERERTALAAGGWRTTEVDRTFNDQGLEVTEDDLGDVSIPTDDLCTRTSYARNDAAWMIDNVSREETVSVNCSTTPARPGDVIGDDRTYYDGLAFGAAPTRGDETKTEEIASYSGATPVYLTTETNSYDAYGRELTSTDAAGHVTTTAYTPASGGLATHIEVTNPAGFVTKTDVEPAWGLPTKTVDANGKTTNFAYDPLGRLTSVWLPGRNPATQSPNLRYDYLVRTDGATAVSTGKLRNDGTYATSYALLDGFLRPRQTQEPAPGGGRVVTDTLYDSRGLETKSNQDYYADGTPGTTLFVPASDDDVPGQTLTVYDGAERETAEIFRVHGTEKWRTITVYGGDRESVTPPDGGVPTTTVTDARDRVVQRLQYHGDTASGPADVTTYTYTPDGDLATATDPAGNRWAYTYDLRGRKTRADDPDTGTTTTVYDDLDQVTSTTDSRGVTLAYTYDTLGRKTAEYAGSTSGTKLAEWTYDTLAKGQLTSSTRYVNGNAYTSAVTGYDDLYRPTGNTVIIPAAEGKLAGTYTTTATYNLDGTLAQQTIPAAGGLPAETMTYGYDELGEPTTTRGFTTYVTATIYGKLGQILQETLSAGGKRVLRANTFEDGTNRLARVLDQRETSPVTISDDNYTYDAAGEITKIADTPAGQAVDVQCFTYDYLQRLTQAWTATDNCTAPPSTSVIGGAAPYWQSFGYDLTGNRTTETDHDTTGGAADVTHTYTYPAAGQPHPHALQTVATAGGPADGRVDTYGYDQTGDTTTRAVAGKNQTLTWDAEGNLATLTDTGATTTFLYDPDGDLLIRHDPDTATLLLGNQEVTLDTATGVVSAVRYYDHAGQTIATRTTSGLAWLLADHHGTADTAVDETTQAVTRRRYTPFGQQRGTTPTTWPGQRGFVGGIIDGDTGLVTLGARDYDPDTGRFDAVDPVIDPDDPQQLNGYAYANNNPVTMSDPDGLWTDGPLRLPPKKKKKKHHTSSHHSSHRSSHRSGRSAYYGRSSPCHFYQYGCGSSHKTKKKSHSSRPVGACRFYQFGCYKQKSRPKKKSSGRSLACHFWQFECTPHHPSDKELQRLHPGEENRCNVTRTYCRWVKLPKPVWQASGGVCVFICLNKTCDTEGTCAGTGGGRGPARTRREGHRSYFKRGMKGFGGYIAGGPAGAPLKQRKWWVKGCYFAPKGACVTIGQRKGSHGVWHGWFLGTEGGVGNGFFGDVYLPQWGFN